MPRRADGTHPIPADALYAPQGWVFARDLKQGYALTTADGRRVVVLAAKIEQARRAVYNLEVAPTHTYFVGHRATWVHNDNAPDALPNTRANRLAELDDGRWLDRNGQWRNPNGSFAEGPPDYVPTASGPRGRQRGDRMTSRDNPVEQHGQMEAAQNAGWQGRGRRIDSIEKSRRRAENDDWGAYRDD